MELLHFMLCHSKRCHRPRTSSCHTEQRAGTCHGTELEATICLSFSILQVLNTHGEALTMTSLSAMPYLDAVLKEAMRLIPAARVGMRKATRDLNYDGIIVPKGSIVAYCIDTLHALEPTLWKGPESIPKGATVPPHMDFRGNLRQAFEPGRWLKEGMTAEGAIGSGKKPRLFATFGGGVHLCLGMNLANTEVKLFLASLLRRGCRWEMEEKGLLQKLVVFPFVGTPEGTDWMVLERKEELVLHQQQQQKEEGVD